MRWAAVGFVIFCAPCFASDAEIVAAIDSLKAEVVLLSGEVVSLKAEVTAIKTNLSVPAGGTFGEVLQTCLNYLYAIFCSLAILVNIAVLGWFFWGALRRWF